MRRRWLERGILLVLAAGVAFWWRSEEEPPVAEAWSFAQVWTVDAGAEVLELTTREGKAAARLSEAALLLRADGEADPVPLADLSPRVSFTPAGELEVRGDVVWRKELHHEVDLLTRWADLDGDGGDELVVADDASSRLVVYDGADGTEEWSRDLDVHDLAVVPANAWGPGYVYATDAISGLLWRFSARGETLQMRAMEAGAVGAARMSAGGSMQSVAEVVDPTYAMLGPGATMRLEARGGDGRFLWSIRDHMPRPGLLGKPSVRALAEDLDGDGVREWVLRDRHDRLMVRSADGVQKAVMPVQRSWTLLARPNGRALVLTSQGSRVTAWEARTGSGR